MASRRAALSDSVSLIATFCSFMFTARCHARVCDVAILLIYLWISDIDYCAELPTYSLSSEASNEMDCETFAVFIRYKNIISEKLQNEVAM